MFSQSTIEQLKYYVYLLKDPTSNEIFYVGKGINNRLFNHLNCALEGEENSDKLNRIRDIISSGNNVIHYVLRHGLSEDEAFKIEASVIDVIGMQNLTNVQSGHYSDDYGLKTVDEITAIYEAESLRTTESVILINLNRLYHHKITETELYEATRKSWKLGLKREKAKYAIATYRGLTREIYKINSWFQEEDRWAFEGDKADYTIRNQLRYKSIKSFFPKGAANPIKYINC